MSLDLIPADSVTVAAAAARLQTTPVSVYRWIQSGVTVGGRRVKLAAVRVGGHYLIPLEALGAFVRACNPSAEQAPESPTAIRRRCEADKARLAALLGGGS